MEGAESQQASSWTAPISQGLAFAWRKRSKDKETVSQHCSSQRVVKWEAVSQGPLPSLKKVKQAVKNPNGLPAPSISQVTAICKNLHGARASLVSLYMEYSCLDNSFFCLIYILSQITVSGPAKQICIADIADRT